jgi:hypothetical protein
VHSLLLLMPMLSVGNCLISTRLTRLNQAAVSGVAEVPRPSVDVLKAKLTTLVA